MTNLEVEWLKLVKNICWSKPTTRCGNRKLFRNYVWEVPGDSWDGLSYGIENLGYGPAKVARLDRVYFNEEEFTKINQKFQSRSDQKQSCLTARFGAGAKGKDSQGYCMQTITLSYVKGEEFQVIVNYRSTDLGVRFFADLIFLQNKVFPIVLRWLPKPDKIIFNFSCLFLTPFPLQLIFQAIGFKKFLITTKVIEPKLFSNMNFYVRSYMNPDPNSINFNQMKPAHKAFHQYIYPLLSQSDISYINKLLEKK